MFEYFKFLASLGYSSVIEPSGPFLEAKDYPDLTGQKWVVTGATGGIGLELSKILAHQNAEVWMVGRSKAKLDDAEAILKQSNPQAKIYQMVIDFSDLKTVEPAVAILKKETNLLNGIIHNAGVMDVAPDARTKQGLDLTMGVNNVASQHLQNLLDPLIVNTPNGRIVWLSSALAMFAPKFGFDAKIAAGGHADKAYAVSKALNYIQSVQWSLNHKESSVKSLSVHPGVIKSGITRTSPPFRAFLANLFGSDLSYGVHSPIFAALSPKAVNNDYIVPYGKPGPVRSDIYSAARNEHGAAALAWVNDKIKSNI